MTIIIIDEIFISIKYNKSFVSKWKFEKIVFLIYKY